MAVNGNPTAQSKSTIEKVGVILVHGIGEQRRFEHLESETRKIVNAIIDRYGQRRCDVTITLTTGSGDAFQGDQSSWVSGAHAPIHALESLTDSFIERLSQVFMLQVFHVGTIR